MQVGALFALLAFIRGFEEVKKTWSGKSTEAGGRRSSAREGLERRVFFNFRRNKGSMQNYTFRSFLPHYLRTVL